MIKKMGEYCCPAGGDLTCHADGVWRSTPSVICNRKETKNIYTLIVVIVVVIVPAPLLALLLYLACFKVKELITRKSRAQSSLNSQSSHINSINSISSGVTTLITGQNQARAGLDMQLSCVNPINLNSNGVTMLEHNCPICHDEFKEPIKLSCKHIFCKECVSKWFDQERTCPLCRATIADNPFPSDGFTSYTLQHY